MLGYQRRILSWGFTGQSDAKSQTLPLCSSPSQDFYLDLLFYYLRLRCYVVIELKAGKFEPGHVSQLNMYLNVVDDLLRHLDDKPSIGLLLVKDKNRTVVEYSLAGYTKPIGVAQWERQMTQSLPDDLKPSLPSIEEIEAELAEADDDE
jgi:YhcG PDDEXK nuclease domain